jgi:signal transduction histidine kinase
LKTNNKIQEEKSKSKFHDFYDRIEMSIKGKIYKSVLYSFIIFIIITFISANYLVNHYFEALVRSQSENISFQKWRTVSFGILNGWNLPISMSSICIYDGSHLVLEMGENCQQVHNDSIYRFLNGKNVNFVLSQFKFMGKLNKSLWFIIILIPIIFYFIIYAIYYFFKRSESSINEKDLINFFDSFDQDQKNLSVIEQKLHEKTNEIIMLRNNDVLVNMASQVSHDIRSPLAALSMVTKHLEQIPEDDRIIIRESIERIKDIANTLLDQTRNQSFKKDVILQDQNKTDLVVLEKCLIPYLLESIVSEKRIQYRGKYNINILLNQNENSYGLFSEINKNEFKTLISNIINNSVEAIEKNQTESDNLNFKGDINIYVSKKNDLSINIEINDNGIGIPAEIINNLGSRGMTFGKEKGNGLGLFHAINTIEKYEGEIHFYSEWKKGTKIEISLPEKVRPDWFMESLRIFPHQIIVILDDDLTIHKIWEKRFSEEEFLKQDTKIYHFANSKDLINLYYSNLKMSQNEVLFLLDFELIKDEFNGLELIEKLDISKNSILVTSRFEDKLVLDKVKSIGLKLLPKSMAEIIPLRLEKIRDSFLENNPS